MERRFVDEETGESVIHPLFDGKIWTTDARKSTSMCNVETGEPEVGSFIELGVVKSRRIPFRIPKEVRESLSNKEASTKTRCNLMELEPVPVGACFGQINPVCLFLPAIFYFRWFLALLMIFEVALHVWAHRKNKALKNASVYFRSPFHAVSSEFCAICQNETCMNRIGKMQQIRMHKFLRQCNYMKKVVT